MEMIKPEDCLKHDVCKFVGDAGCLEGCDFRLEVAFRSASDNTSSPKLPDYEEVVTHLECEYGARKWLVEQWKAARHCYDFLAGKIGR